MADKYIRSLVVLNQKFSAKDLKDYMFVCGNIDESDFYNFTNKYESVTKRENPLLFSVGKYQSQNAIVIRAKIVESIQASEKIYDAEKVYTVEE